jgi:hypothetical protein
MTATSKFLLQCDPQDQRCHLPNGLSACVIDRQGHCDSRRPNRHDVVMVQVGNPVTLIGVCAIPGD